MPLVPLSAGLQHGLWDATVEAHDPDAHALGHMVRGDTAHRLSSTVAMRLESVPSATGGTLMQPPKGHRKPRAHRSASPRAQVREPKRLRNGCHDGSCKRSKMPKRVREDRDVGAPRNTTVTYLFSVSQETRHL